MSRSNSRNLRNSLTALTLDTSDSDPDVTPKEAGRDLRPSTASAASEPLRDEVVLNEYNKTLIKCVSNHNGTLIN